MFSKPRKWKGMYDVTPHIVMQNVDLFSQMKRCDMLFISFLIYLLAFS